MSSMKLYYFGLPGRAENTRLMLKYGGIEFEDLRFSFNDWPTHKPNMPFGQVPVLEHNGKMLAESSAIERYVASMTGLLPKDTWAAALADQCVGMLSGFWELLIPTMKITDIEERTKARQELAAGPIKEKLQMLTKCLSNGEYVAGDSLSFADFSVFTMLCTLKSGWLDGIPTNILDDFPELKEFRNKIANVPAIKAFYENEEEPARLAFRPE